VFVYSQYHHPCSLAYHSIRVSDYRRTGDFGQINAFVNNFSPILFRLGLEGMIIMTYLESIVD